MATGLSIIQTILVLFATWAAWRILKFLASKDPLAIIPGPPSGSWLTGNITRLTSTDPWDYFKQVTDEYGSVFRVTGPANSSNLFVYDPKALQHIILKEQHIYEESQDFILTNSMIFGKGLASTMGETHRRQRKLLSPAFSVAHMREMTPIFHDVIEKLRDSLKRQVVQGEKEIDLLSWMTRTSLEIIGQGGFGYSFDTLEQNSFEHPFARSLKNYSGAINDATLSLLRFFLLPHVIDLGTPKLRRAFIDCLPSRRIRQLRDMVDLMHETSVEIFEATKRALALGESPASAGRIGERKDIMSALVRANMHASKEDRLPESELLAQISTFIFAGMDTTSNALSRVLHVLSEHPDAQERLRQETITVQQEHGERLDYDTLNSLPWLDAVLKETLRRYPPGPLHTRHPNKDVILPLSQPIVTLDGKAVTEIFVPNDTRIIISMLHSNTNPDIWGPDVLEWKPERWLAPLPDSVGEARVPGVYSHLLTFLGGNRGCIGFKFTELEMKVILSTLVSTLRFSPGRQEIEWEMNGLIQPTVADAERSATGRKKLQLPLKVSLVR